MNEETKTPKDRRIEEILDLIMKMASGNLRGKGTQSNRGDDLDGFIGGHNMLGEELFASTVSREYVDNIFKSMVDALIVVNPDTSIRTVNQATLALLAYEEGELIGKPIKIIFAEEEEEEEEELFKKSGIEDLIQKGSIRNIEKTFVRKDGRKIPVLFSGSVMRDNEGEIQGIVCVARDITGRKRAEAKLLYYARLVESVPDAIVSSDTSFNVLSWNKAAEEMYGWRSDEVIGKPIVNFIPTKYVNDTSENVKRQLLSGAGIWAGEAIHTRRDGTTLHARTTASVLKDADGNVTGIVAITQDITSRKQAEEELRDSHEQLRSLSAHLQSVREDSQKLLAREIHDELGQDLTALKMDLSWMQKKLRKDQTILYEKAGVMTGLADAMIQTVKRIAARLRPAMLDDLGVAAALEWEMEEFERRTGIGCELTVEPKEIDIDPDRSTAVYRIFQEALTNIARHAKATNVEASLKVHADMIEMKIRDNGIGITEKQVASPLAFGLIGMRERVQQFGGETTVVGMKEEGTTLNVTILLANGEDHND